MINIDDFANRPPRGLEARRGARDGPPPVPLRADAAPAARLGRGRAVRGDRSRAAVLRPAPPDRRRRAGHDRGHHWTGTVMRSQTYQESPVLMDYVPYTDNTRRQLDELAALKPRMLAAMHGSTFVGDGAALLTASADVIRDVSAAAAPRRSSADAMLAASRLTPLPAPAATVAARWRTRRRQRRRSRASGGGGCRDRRSDAETRAVSPLRAARAPLRAPSPARRRRGARPRAAGHAADDREAARRRDPRRRSDRLVHPRHQPDDDDRSEAARAAARARCVEHSSSNRWRRTRTTMPLSTSIAWRLPAAASASASGWSCC